MKPTLQILRAEPAAGRRRKGQAALELAMILPLFMLVLLGTLEMGKMAWWNHLLANSVRQGARVASVGKTKAVILSNVIDRARPIVITSTNITLSVVTKSNNGNGNTSSGSFPNDDNTVTPSQNGAPPNDIVTVSISVPYQPIIPIASLKNLTIKQYASMVRELVP